MNKNLFSISKKGRDTVISLTGRLDAQAASRLWQEWPGIVQATDTHGIVLDLEHLDYLDTAGAALLCHLESRFTATGKRRLSFGHLSPDYAELVDMARNVSESDTPASRPAPLSFVETQGGRLAAAMSESREFITHIGEIVQALFQSLIRPRSIRWADVFMVAERAGVDALPIVALISFIVGLVMAFQAAIPMRMFGAELYVANLIGIAMVRELGPLMTAIVLAGRSASAFAAEIGTMRINEEIDALTVMGLDPVKFLIVPRVIAATIMTPLLAVFANLVGIIGGALVIIGMGYPLVSYYNQVIAFASWGDFTGGMVKCLVFGLLIAAAGCIRGYQTRSGASAVGLSTTRAVVTGIILIAVFDGLFSIVYYFLDI